MAVQSQLGEGYFKHTSFLNPYLPVCCLHTRFHAVHKANSVEKQTLNTFQLFLYNYLSGNPKNYDETGGWYGKSKEWKCYQSLVKNKGLGAQAVGEYVERLKGEFDDAFSKIDLVRCTQIFFIVRILLEECPFSKKVDSKKEKSNDLKEKGNDLKEKGNDFKRKQCKIVLHQMESSVKLLENRETAQLGKRMLTSVKMLKSYKLADGIRDLLGMLGVAIIAAVGIVALVVLSPGFKEAIQRNSSATTPV